MSRGSSHPLGASAKPAGRQQQIAKFLAGSRLQLDSETGRQQASEQIDELDNRYRRESGDFGRRRR